MNKLLNILCLYNRTAKSKTGLKVFLKKPHYIIGEISLSITIPRANMYTTKDYTNSNSTNSDYTTVAHTCHPHLT